MLGWWLGWWWRWRERRACFHHDHNTGRSWIRTVGIFGGSKHFECCRCSRYWT